MILRDVLNPIEKAHYTGEKIGIAVRFYTETQNC
jgi:hypothetical protein